MRSRNRWAAILLVVLAVGACQQPVDTLDDDATHVRERLGDLCSSFDFGTKRQINGEPYRPVKCKNQDDAVTLRIVVFANDQHKERSWRELSAEEDAVKPGPAGPVMLDVDDVPALVEVYDRSLLDEVRARL